MRKLGCKFTVFLVCLLLACVVMTNVKGAKADVILWGDTFETLDNWTGTTEYHLNDTYAHSDPYSVSANATSTTFATRSTSFPSGAKTATYTLFFFLASTTNSANYPFNTPNSISTAIGSNGNFTFGVGGGSWDDYHLCDKDVWYKLTVTVDITAHTVTCKLFNSDTSEDEFESVVYDVGVTELGTHVSFNLNGFASTASCFVDDYMVSYSMGSSPASPPPSVSVSLVDLYFRSDTYTSFGTSAFGLDSLPYWEEDVDAYFFVGGGVGASAAVGYRVWLVSDGASTELTAGTPEAVEIFTSQTGDAVDFYWTCPNVPVVMGYEALKITVYYSNDFGGNWAALGSFVSKPLVTGWLVSSTWKITAAIFFAPSNVIVFDFSEYTSYETGASFGVTNIQIADPDTHELMMYKLSNMDLLGFILTPYISIFGGIFYAIMLAAILGAYYIWYQKTSVVLFMLVLFGSAGGFVFVLLPTPANILVWILMAVALAVLLFRVIR